MEGEKKKAWKERELMSALLILSSRFVNQVAGSLSDGREWFL